METKRRYSETSSDNARNAINPSIGSSFGEIAMFMGHFEGRYADEIQGLNQQNIWNATPPLLPATRNSKRQNAPPWRGQLPAHIVLNGPIYCHSFRSLPIRSDGWHHGAVSSGVYSSKKPRDFAYPLNRKSSISSSAFRLDFDRDACDQPVPRLTCLQPHHPIIIYEGSLAPIHLTQGRSILLVNPIQIDLITLKFWIWFPRRDAEEQAIYKKNVEAFDHRANSLPEYLAEITSGSTTAPISPTLYQQKRLGRSGIEYIRWGPDIGSGASRSVFRVDSVDNAVSSEATGGTEQSSLRFVGKEMHWARNDTQGRKKKNRERMEKEYTLVMNNPHPHINTVYDISYIPGTDAQPWIIEEYLECCLQMDHFPVPIDEGDMLLQLSSGLRHLHDLDIMHRDVKPANVMMQLVSQAVVGADGNSTEIKKWLYKWTDFGNAQIVEDRIDGLVGSLFFCAPEVLDGEWYNAKADVFSLGILALRFFAGYSPYQDETLREDPPRSSNDIQGWMVKSIYPRVVANAEPKYWPLLEGMLMRAPENRWSAAQILDFVRQISHGGQVFSVAEAAPYWVIKEFNGRKRRTVPQPLALADIISENPGVSVTVRQYAHPRPTDCHDDDLTPVPKDGFNIELNKSIDPSSDETSTCFYTAVEDFQDDVAPMTSKPPSTTNHLASWPYAVASREPATPSNRAEFASNAGDSLPSAPVTPIPDSPEMLKAFGMPMGLLERSAVETGFDYSPRLFDWFETSHERLSVLQRWGSADSVHHTESSACQRSSKKLCTALNSPAREGGANLTFHALGDKSPPTFHSDDGQSIPDTEPWGSFHMEQIKDIRSRQTPTHLPK